MLRVAPLLVLLGSSAAHADLPQLRSGNVFQLDVSGAAARADSAAITSWLESNSGWGTGNLRIDFSIDVVDADAAAPTVDLVQNPVYYSPDCDASGSVPLPAGGTVEGNDGYQCLSGGDCHLLVHDAARSLLFEAFIADVTGGIFTATCLVEWNLLAAYPPNLRGEGCTSADAAGFPIAPLLFDADEVAAGEIAHAIRFVLPNSRIRAGQYVHPATHYGAPSAPAGSDAPIYGMRFRLRGDFAMGGYSPAARVILEALQKYGMFLADGGNIALTARSDRGTTAKWSELGIDSFSLVGVEPSDFEVLEGHGPDPHKGPYPGWPDCVRNTVPEPDAGMLAAVALGALLVRKRAERAAAR
jgi:serine/threonine-protein kinase